MYVATSLHRFGGWTFHKGRLGSNQFNPDEHTHNVEKSEKYYQYVIDDAQRFVAVFHSNDGNLVSS